MSFLRKITRGIRRLSRGLGKRVKQRGRNIISRGIKRTIQAGKNLAKQSLKDILSGRPDKVIDNIKDIPSRVLRAGKDIAFEEGKGLIEDLKGDAKTAVTNRLKQARSDFEDKISGKGLPRPTKIFDQVGDTFKEIPRIGRRLLDKGKEIVSGDKGFLPPNIGKQKGIPITNPSTGPIRPSNPSSLPRKFINDPAKMARLIKQFRAIK